MATFPLKKKNGSFTFLSRRKFTFSLFFFSPPLPFFYHRTKISFILSPFPTPQNLFFVENLRTLPSRLELREIIDGSQAALELDGFSLAGIEVKNQAIMHFI